MKLNTPVKPTPIFTHEGAKAKRIGPELELSRTIMAHMLWENSFYESGQSVANRIKDLVQKVDPETVAELALIARTDMKLRHVPLLLCRELARTGKLKPEYLTAVIQRPDEISEFLAIYWAERKCPISKAVKVGLNGAFNNPSFNEYSFGKYKNGAIRLRDVMFLTHPKPDEGREELFKKIANDTLETPDTWEVALSGGADKAETFTRLINEKKLGGLALLRNLRNMEQSGVKRDVVVNALLNMKTERILPFRFISAVRAAPTYSAAIEKTMLSCLQEHPKLHGTTVIVVDNSGSMDSAISSKSDLTRKDAAGALAILVREICDDPIIISFASNPTEIRADHGFALSDAIKKSPSGATHTGRAVKLANEKNPDRIIVITDEQSATAVPDPAAKNAYFVNVANYQNGIGYGKWIHIDGWSEAIVSYILAYEDQ